MERSVGLLDFDWFALPLLLLKNRAEVSILTVVFAALHVKLITNIIINHMSFF